MEGSGLGGLGIRRRWFSVCRMMRRCLQESIKVENPSCRAETMNHCKLHLVPTTHTLLFGDMGAEILGSCQTILKYCTLHCFIKYPRSLASTPTLNLRIRDCDRVLLPIPPLAGFSFESQSGFWCLQGFGQNYRALKHARFVAESRGIN